MKFTEYKYLLQSDLYRITGNKKITSFLWYFLFEGTYRYNFWMRTGKYAKSCPLLKCTIYPIARLLLKHYEYKFGVSIPYYTEIGSGFYIGHFGGIVVNGRCKIGKNCNISHGVTIGQSNRGKSKGYPVLGDNIYIGPGAKIIGAVTIGNNTAIGANCVVTKDVPDNAVVVGVPGKVISYEGAKDYVNKTDYDNSR